MKNSAELYASGYALYVHNISHEEQSWRYREDTFTTKRGSVPMYDCVIDDCPVMVAKIEDVQKTAHG